MNSTNHMKLVVTDVRCEAKDILVLELRHPQGDALPPFSAGAHVEIQLPNGLKRQYSLCNAPHETDRYCIGVGLARESRGGSIYIHKSVRVGTELSVSHPRNLFPLSESRDEHVFIAGGIGITPFVSMIEACEAKGVQWRLIYCTRNRQRAAFLDQLSASYLARCTLHFDDEAQRVVDIEAVLSDVAESAHIYCCGPQPLMESVKRATESRDPEKVNFEWFKSCTVTEADNKPFSVILRHSKARVDVPATQSILDALEAHGFWTPFSCREGLCATCRVPVISGIPDHRDQVLSAAEKAANKEIVICVSRAKTDVLELAL